MYIIVAGGGKVGYYLSKELLSEGHEVLIIEQNAKKCAQIAEELGSIAIRGDACEPKNEAILKKLGIHVTVSSTNLILEHIEVEVPTHPLVHLLELKAQGLEIVDIRIAPTSPAAGKPLKDVPLPANSVVSL